MEIYLVYLVLGAVAGLISGLFGLGGGVVIVPILIFAFSWLGFSPDVLTHCAIGTSLATIVITSLSSVTGHHRKAAVNWSVFFRLTPAICAGALLGGVFAAMLSGVWLQLAFGIFLCVIAAKMAMSLSATAATIEMPGLVGKSIAGTIIGFVSSLFGIGGGSLTVPFLTWVKTPMKMAVGTSAACGLPIAVSGSLSYIWQGIDHPHLPAGALGFVYIPAFLGIVLTSIPFAKVGVQLAHRLPAELLKKGFALLLLFIGLRFIWNNVMAVIA